MSQYSVRCNICGHFMSQSQIQDAVMTLKHCYGTAMEPPDEVFNHRDCIEKQRQILQRASDRTEVTDRPYVAEWRVAR